MCDYLIGFNFHLKLLNAVLTVNWLRVAYVNQFSVITDCVIQSDKAVQARGSGRPVLLYGCWMWCQSVFGMMLKC